MVDFNAMVSETRRWFNKQPLEFRIEFINTPKNSLVKYHSTIGRQIRNGFKLWETSWKPVISNGVDVSPEHPDQISHRVVEEVWETMRQEVENS